MRKIIILILIGLLSALIMIGCDGGGVVPPGNGGNGDIPSSAESTVLVEAYIAVKCPFCSQIEPIIENLATEYGKDKMILVELAPWGANYSISEAYQRYKWYGLTDGVPQVTFNGLNNNFHGVKSYSEIKNRIEAQLSQSPIIELGASRTTSSSITTISGKVKNISGATLTNLVVNGMSFVNRGITGFRYSVTDIFEEHKVIISSLASGEEKEFTMTIPNLNWDIQGLDGVIFVQSLADGKKTIMQSLFLD
jgi:thiol-disulfide isomerase/thioredoxin